MRSTGIGVCGGGVALPRPPSAAISRRRPSVLGAHRGVVVGRARREEGLEFDRDAYERPSYEELRRKGRERSGGLPRRIFDFAWPFAALWLANRQQPVGDVPVRRSEEEWRALLAPETYHVLRERGTERAGSSPLDKQYSEGQYKCAGCQAPLFTSATKFDSGTGWPSFYAPIPGSVELTLQLLYCLGDFGAREVRCKACGGHLGHVFTDGPPPTGKRFCMNGVALAFDPADSKKSAECSTTDDSSS